MSWMDRTPKHEHYQNFRNLADLHRMTLSWVESVAQGSLNLPDHLLRVSSPGIRQTLEQLSVLSQEALPITFEEILKEWDPEELIPTFDRIVKSLQAWVLQGLLDRTPTNEHESLMGVLENTSFDSGQKLAETRWKALLEKNPTFTLKEAYQAWLESPLGLPPGKQNLLLMRRQATDEIRVESFLLPLHSPYWEIKPIAKELTRLHLQWIRGFLYRLNSQILVSEEQLKDRHGFGLCLQIHSELPRSSNLPNFL